MSKTGLWNPTTRPKGREKGAVNVTTATARHGIAKVYKLLGGEQGLWTWACKNDRNLNSFYTLLLPKLIPAEIADQHGTSDTKLQVVILPANAQSMPKAVEAQAMPRIDERTGTDHAQ